MSLDLRAPACPFCGGESELYPGVPTVPKGPPTLNQVRCLSPSCGAWGPAGTAEAARAAWTRPAAYHRESCSRWNHQIDALHERVALLEQARDLERGVPR